MTAKKRIVLRSWRVQDAEPSGFFVWFDAARESVELYELEPPEESGVVALLEGDDQRGLFDEVDQVNISSPGHGELPF